MYATYYVFEVLSAVQDVEGDSNECCQANLHSRVGKQLMQTDHPVYDKIEMEKKYDRQDITVYG